MNEDCIQVLQTLCFFRDAGIYESVTEGMTVLDDNDIYELFELGFDAAAPITYREDIPMDGSDTPLTADEIAALDVYQECDHYHTVYHYSSPDMREYYRLCRLYEYREGIEPKDDPFVRFASDDYDSVIRQTYGQFCAFFDDDTYTTELMIEICPEWYYDPTEIIRAIIETLKYYDENLSVLERELAKTPFVFLPALPARAEQKRNRGKSAAFTRKPETSEKEAA
jgi:hypothetical protein